MIKICIVLIILSCVFFMLGALSHEYDMARNYKNYGNAKAWIFEIKQ